MKTDLPEIPSEFIEPYIIKFFGSILESVALGYLSPTEARQQLIGVEWFVDINCGVHARIATSNIFEKLKRLSDDDMLKISQKCILA